MTTSITYTRAQLIDALYHEYDYLCHDDYDPDNDMSSSEYRGYLDLLSYDQLIAETDTDDGYTLDEFIANHS
jgi:hypothetical protein